MRTLYCTRAGRISGVFETLGLETAQESRRRPCRSLVHTMVIKCCMHSVFRGRFEHRELTKQLLADLSCTPGGVLPFDLEDGLLDLKRKLVGMTIGSAPAILNATTYPNNPHQAQPATNIVLAQEIRYCQINSHRSEKPNPC
jgi:hypothetical protein